MDPRQPRVDAIRARSTELENHLIDELRARKIGRREFMRRGAIVGMSIPTLGFLASACGVSTEDLEARGQAADRQGRSRAAPSAWASSSPPARSTR